MVQVATKKTHPMFIATNVLVVTTNAMNNDLSSMFSLAFKWEQLFARPKIVYITTSGLESRLGGFQIHDQK